MGEQVTGKAFFIQIFFIFIHLFDGKPAASVSSISMRPSLSEASKDRPRSNKLARSGSIVLIRETLILFATKYFVTLAVC
jgi:hypothetical protein